jgi:hypothetical protein
VGLFCWTSVGCESARSYATLERLGSGGGDELAGVFTGLWTKRHGTDGSLFGRASFPGEYGVANPELPGWLHQRTIGQRIRIQSFSGEENADIGAPILDSGWIWDWGLGDTWCIRKKNEPGSTWTQSFYDILLVLKMWKTYPVSSGNGNPDTTCSACFLLVVKMLAV